MTQELGDKRANMSIQLPCYTNLKVQAYMYTLMHFVEYQWQWWDCAEIGKVSSQGF